MRASSPTHLKLSSSSTKFCFSQCSWFSVVCDGRGDDRSFKLTAVAGGSNDGVAVVGCSSVIPAA